MQLIGAALGDEHHLSARRAPFVSALAGHGHAKLLHGVQRNRQNGIESCDVVLAGGVGALLGSHVGLAADPRVFVVIHIHAVQDHVILIAPRPHHFTSGSNARLQAQQCNHVARVQRQLPN